MELSLRREDIYKIYMIIIGCGGHLLFFFQAYEIYDAGCAKNVSLRGFLISLFSILNWLIYGFVKKDKVLIVCNVIGAIGATTVVGLILTSAG